MPHTSVALPAAYSYEWALFVDWCAAADVSALPASSVTVADFLGENPGTAPVQRRRVAAVDRRHRDAGFVAPGAVTSLRLALDRARADRVAHRAERDGALAAALPWSGSHASLFGRRDAVLLLLAGAGLSFTAIAALDRSDVSTDEGDLWVGGTHRISIAATGFPPDCTPAVSWTRWETVLRFSDRFPSTTLLLNHLRSNSFPDFSALPVASGPVAVPIDRWGHLPFRPSAMTAAAVAEVVAAHRAGVPPGHVTGTARRFRADDNSADRTLKPVVAEQDSVVLDSGYYRRGVDARRRAHTVLSDVAELSDEVDGRIEELLQRTLQLLDGVGLDHI